MKKKSLKVELFKLKINWSEPKWGQDENGNGKGNAQNDCFTHLLTSNIIHVYP